MNNHLKKSQYVLWVVHVVVVSTLMYIGNRTFFLFTIDQNTTVTFVEKIARSFLHAVDEIASFSFQFSFNVKSLLGGLAFVLSYGLLVLYKTFDEKKDAQMKNMEVQNGGNFEISNHFWRRKRVLISY